MPFIDTHAHIYDKQFKEDIAEVMERCLEAEVRQVFMPNIDHTSIDDMLELENRYPLQCNAMMGLHPCSVNKHFEQELYIVEEWLNRRSFIAVGEIGLDYYWDTSFKEQQKEAFSVQIDFAKQFQIPIVIHTRDSFEDAITIVEKKKNENLKGVFHCFTGTVEDAKRIASIGFHIGLGGVSTFKNAKLHEVIPEINLNTTVLETDSPYLAPVPNRGKRNEPAYIPLIARKIGEYKKLSQEEIGAVTTQSALALFKTP